MRPCLPVLATLILLIGTTVAGAAEKQPQPAAAPARSVPAVSVNVNVNVHVSRDVKVDVKVEAPFAPVIGTLQMPEFVQKLLGNFLFKSPSPPAGKSEAAPAKK